MEIGSDALSAMNRMTVLNAGRAEFPMFLPGKGIYRLIMIKK